MAVSAGFENYVLHGLQAAAKVKSVSIPNQTPVTAGPLAMTPEPQPPPELPPPPPPSLGGATTSTPSLEDACDVKRHIPLLTSP